jgi:putative hydrolase of the HAD superfamily
VTGPRAVLLDAFGTLLRLEEPWLLLAGELERRGVHVTMDEARAALRAEMSYYRAHHDEGRDAAALEDLHDRCAAVLAGALPPAARALAGPDLRAALLTSLRFALFPEVPAVLRELRARGARLVVVSNWDVSLHGVLDRTGLAPLVDAALASAEVGAPKPDPAIFAAALAAAGGVAPSDALHVGDSVETDVEGARRAGIHAVLVARDGAGAPAGVPAVEDLSGVLEHPLYRQGAG